MSNTTASVAFARPTGFVAGIVDRSPDITRLIEDVVNRAEGVRDHAQIISRDADDLVDKGLVALLETRTGELTKLPPTGLIAELADLGFSWRDIATMSGVSVPALRKWRAGESVKPDNRRRLARLVAFTRVVAERSPHIGGEIASWLEVRIHDDAPVTGIDLLADGHFGLLFQYAGDLGRTPTEILDEYEPGWEQRYSTNVETYVASDGHPALRLRD
jgi:transcriptional regulator with XRE-family HTH domain